jgi:hypothetical protein
MGPVGGPFIAVAGPGEDITIDLHRLRRSLGVWIPEGDQAT